MWVGPLKLVLSKGSTASNFPKKTLDLRRDDGIPYGLVREGGREGEREERAEQNRRDGENTI